MTNRTRSKTTKWNIFFHYIFIVLMVFSGIILVPLYLKYIPIRTYGLWLATGNVLVWLTAIDPGISLLLQQKVAKAYGESNNKLVVSYINSGLILTICLCVLITIIGLITYLFLDRLLPLPNGKELFVFKLSFLFTLFGSVLMIFSYSIIAINQGLQSSKGNGIIYIFASISSILISIYLIQHNYGLIAIAITPLVTGLGLTCGHFIYLFNRIRKEKINYFFDIGQIHNLSKLLSFTFLGRLGGVVASNMDLFILARFIGPESVAVLNISRKGPELGKIIVERPVIAILPSLSHLSGTNDFDKIKTILSKFLNIMIWTLGLVVSGFIALNHNFVNLWVGDKMFIGTLISFLICINILISSFVSNLANLCFSLGNIKNNSIVAFFQSIITLLFVFVGAYYFGILGVVVAPIVSNILLSLWFYPKTLIQLINLNYNELSSFKFEILKTVIVLSIVSFLFSLFIVDTWVKFILISLLLSMIYIILLYLFSKSFRIEVKKLTIYNI